jgi:hypothetical protein
MSSSSARDRRWSTSSKFFGLLSGKSSKHASSKLARNGQAPNIWGGYDYAKLLKKIQFIEAYNLGSAQAIIRSLSPQNALPQVTTHFHSPQRGLANDIWQSWYYFAHGNRGMIGWVEGWFDGKKPRPWLDGYKSTLKELGSIQGPKMVGARWRHDGVALYYSHPSVQVSWCLDIQPHGKTWVNRIFSRASFGWKPTRMPVIPTRNTPSCSQPRTVGSRKVLRCPNGAWE